MTSHASKKEWPLVVFTVALQFACGLSIAAMLVDWKASPSEVAQLRPLAVAIFPIVALGMLASLLHLGRPLLAGRALLNLRRSKLSVEVLLSTFFACSALIYSGLWFTGATQPRLAGGIVTATLGLGAVVSSAMIYMLPTRPIWNSGWLPASFLGTTLLLGGLPSAALVAGAAEATLLRTFVNATVAGSALLLLSAFWMLKHSSRLRAEQSASADIEAPRPLLNSREYLWLVLYIGFAGVMPGVIALMLWPVAGAPDLPAIALRFAALPFAMLGVLLGRMLMYSIAPRFSGF
ncbi:MAG TPA: DmsC/YnfH family molybdoenzyme membrane anchor subunit [Clostridia bacterium]|nr:DmsC/YnfH family molybdoenzyme membrane anchor subunit [Clostridia bacterium]